jgi:hypothetical protein
MTQPIRRVLIQEKLANGRLPRTHMLRKGLLRGLTLAALAALGTMTCVASAGAVTRIDSCGPLSAVGETYVLTKDLSACGDCLLVAGDRITIDLAGHAILGICADAAVGAGITDNGKARQGTVVKNGTIMGFGTGVDLGFSTRNEIRNLTSSANSADGIVVGDRSLMKSCLVEGNGQDGIVIRGDLGQVQDCTIGGSGTLDGNGRFGISGGSRLLITHNTVVGNLSGILVGFFSTVSFNTSSFNTISGVLALDHSLITGNKTIGNGTVPVIASDGVSSVGGIDIDVQCPSTVTNNTASGSMNNYNFNGPQSRCQTSNNK